MNEVNQLKRIVVSLNEVSEEITDFYADCKMSVAIHHLVDAIKALEELENGEY